MYWTSMAWENTRRPQWIRCMRDLPFSSVFYTSNTGVCLSQRCGVACGGEALSEQSRHGRRPLKWQERHEMHHQHWRIEISCSMKKRDPFRHDWTGRRSLSHDSITNSWNPRASRRRMRDLEFPWDTGVRHLSFLCGINMIPETGIWNVRLPDLKIPPSKLPIFCRKIWHLSSREGAAFSNLESETALQQIASNISFPEVPRKAGQGGVIH